MGLPARKLDICQRPEPQTWLSVEDVSSQLRLSIRRVRQLCETQWRYAGFARKVKGVWTISPDADPRIGGIETAVDRDTRHAGEMASRKVPDQYVEQAFRRRQIVQGFLSFGGRSHTDDARRREYIAKLLADGTIPCPGVDSLSSRTLRRWVQEYRKSGDAGGLRALTNAVRRRRGGRVVGEEAWQLFIEVKFAGTGITTTAAYDQVRGFIIDKGLSGDADWAWPSLRRVHIEFQNRTSHPAKVFALKGKRVCEARCIPKIKRSYDDVASGELLVGDERIFDFMSVVPGDRGPRRVRLKLTAWLDARSRMFVGWHIGERANSDTILSAFKSACLRMGTAPARVIIDNGRDYKVVGGPSRRNRKWNDFDSARLQTAFDHLGVETTYAEPHHPWAKMIESHFRTVKNNFDRFAASFWGGKPEERPEDAERWTRDHLGKLWTLEETREHFAEWLKAHHAAPQRGDAMNGLAPEQALRQHFTTTPRFVSEDALRLLCCRRVRRKVGRDGVRIDGIQYGAFDERVFRIQGSDVWVAIDPVVADSVMLCNEDGTPICKANAYKVKGATRDDLRERIATERRFKKIVNKEVPTARRYLMMTPPQQIAKRQRLAAEARQVSDRELPTPAAAKAMKVVRPDVEAAVEKLRKAAGSDAVDGLAKMNPGAAALNAGHRPGYDWGKIGREAIEPEPTPVMERIDWADYAPGKQDCKDENEEVESDVRQPAAG